MALNLGARALDPQVFPAEDERLAVIEGDGQRLAVLVQPQLRWPGCRRCVAHFGLLARRPDEPPGFAMLNLTRHHLGIVHESQFQGLGITGLHWYLSVGRKYESRWRL